MASKKPSKKKTKRKPKVEAQELPDDDAIRKLFPARVVRDWNKKIEHEPKPKKPK